MQVSEAEAKCTRWSVDMYTTAQRGRTRTFIVLKHMQVTLYLMHYETGNQCCFSTNCLKL